MVLGHIPQVRANSEMRWDIFAHTWDTDLADAMLGAQIPTGIPMLMWENSFFWIKRYQYIYIYIHTHVHIYIYTSIYIYICIYMYPQSHGTSVLYHTSISHRCMGLWQRLPRVPCFPPVEPSRSKQRSRGFSRRIGHRPWSRLANDF